MSVRISAREITVVYEAPEGGSLPALGPLSFSLEPGTFVCLVGPSGCGKSTLIRLLAGLQRPTSGAVLADGQPVTQPSRRIGLMFQETNLMPWRTVLDNIALPLELAGVGKTERETAARGLMPLLGLQDFERAYPGELSGGMAQRAALGRVLAQQPAALLLDEPFGALDAMTREQIGLDLMALWERGGQTVVMVTHSIPEAVLLADRILVFTPRPGRIAGDIPVRLPRPRRLDDTFGEVFAETVRRVRGLIG